MSLLRATRQSTMKATQREDDMTKPTILPNGSAFMVLGMKREKFLKRVKHKLFHCPTFWRLKAAFTCPGCGKKYRCYRDGNDVAGHGVDYCSKCANGLESV